MSTEACCVFKRWTICNDCYERHRKTPTGVKSFILSEISRQGDPIHQSAWIACSPVYCTQLTRRTLFTLIAMRHLLATLQVAALPSLICHRILRDRHGWSWQMCQCQCQKLFVAPLLATSCTWPCLLPVLECRQKIHGFDIWCLMLCTWLEQETMHLTLLKMISADECSSCKLATLMKS